ncbi:MAG: acyl-CoA dehydratase activase [Treponema sp.]
MNYVGIDIGSTASKAVIFDEYKHGILHKKVIPSGWNSKETSEVLRQWIESLGFIREQLKIVATGYGRVSVPYADTAVTEITCHGRGAAFLASGTTTVIDIGGQDIKVIVLQNGKVLDFIMNDKCSAGTGKFLEVMANRLGLSLEEMFDYAARGKRVQISSMCTVFAESEVISLMGKGTAREDIAAGVIYSICSKVSLLANRKPKADAYFLTGGFCSSPYIITVLSGLLGAEIKTHEDARFAGAIGAALSA